MPDWKQYTGPKTYYDCRAKLDGQAHYFLWYTMEDFEGEADRLDLAKGHIRTFTSLRKLRAYSKQMELNLQKIGGSRYDLDRIAEWCSTPTSKGINCRTFLDSWNMFDDLLLTLDEEKLMIEGGYKLDGIVYNKLFYGNNVPAIKPDDAPAYVPLWTDEEVMIIHDALSYGLRIFREHLPMLPRN